MAIYRNVSLTFWEDIKIVDNFTPEDRYFYLYLLTNPHTNLLGCYQLSFKQMINESGYSKNKVEKLIDKMENVHKVVKFDENTNEIYIKNWHKYNWTKSDKLLKCVEKEIPTIKSEKLKEEMLKKFKKYTVSIGYIYGMHTTTAVSVTDYINNFNYKDILNNDKLIELFNEYLEYRKNNKLNKSKYAEFYPLENKKDDNNEVQYRRI